MEYSGDQFDVIVIGAGVMGSSTAYQVAKRGHSVLLLEQFDFLHHRGSSHGESRTIRATYPEQYYPQMVVESSKLWEEAESDIGYKVYFKAEQLDIGPTTDKILRAVIGNCQKCSIPHQVLSPSQLSDKYSGRVTIPEGWVGVWSMLGGVIKPTKAVSMFQTLALQKGAALRDNTEVKSIEKSDKEGGGVVVISSNGEKFRGKKCVVTVGAWMKKLVERVSSVTLPLQPLETSVCYWRVKAGHEEDYSIGGGFPTFASYGEPYIYGTPSLEFPGLIKVTVHGGYPCDPDKRPWGPGVSLDPLKEWIEEKFGGRVDSGGPVATQLCMYTMSPDEDFVIDFLGGEYEKEVVVGGGFSGHGFKMSPVVGKILADLALTGGADGVELSHFSLARFQQNPKGNVKHFEDQVNSP